jgi:hypothetical protein
MSTENKFEYAPMLYGDVANEAGVAVDAAMFMGERLNGVRADTIINVGMLLIVMGLFAKQDECDAPKVMNGVKKCAISSLNSLKRCSADTKRKAN